MMMVEKVWYMYGSTTPIPSYDIKDLEDTRGQSSSQQTNEEARVGNVNSFRCHTKQQE